MCWRRSRYRTVAAVTALLAGVASTAYGAGYGLFEHGSKAMGMAGAFTAQADDPSAMFHNVGGLAFFGEREFLAGFTYISTSKARFTGAAPFPGAEVSDRQDSLSEITPHFYWVQPVGDRVNFGLGLFAPFGLATNWDSDSFVGRFLNFKAGLEVVDITPNIGLQVNDRLGIGLGAVLRVAEVELNRRLPQINPFTSQPADIASVSLQSDTETGYAWQVGLLFKATDRLSIGLSYRGEGDVDFGGDARFEQLPTGYPEFDALVRATLPVGVDLPIKTTLHFPAIASLGVAYLVRENLLVEVDLNYAGWDVVDQVTIDFEAPDLENEVLRQDWDDSYNYRLGVRWTRARAEWRFGFVFDETPQPDESVGPVLPDSDRTGFTAGYGRQRGGVHWDAAIMYLPSDDRTTLVNRDNFFGTYETTGWLFGVTFGF